MNNNAPAPDATVEPQKCCGTCLHFRGKSYSQVGRCRVPLPEWLNDFEFDDISVHETLDGHNCVAWRKRGAE